MTSDEQVKQNQKDREARDAQNKKPLTAEEQQVADGEYKEPEPKKLAPHESALVFLLHHVERTAVDPRAHAQAIEHQEILQDFPRAKKAKWEQEQAVKEEKARADWAKKEQEKADRKAKADNPDAPTPFPGRSPAQVEEARAKSEQESPKPVGAK